jgi:hypothetical protein
MEEVGWIKEIGSRMDRGGGGRRMEEGGERGGMQKKRKMKVDNHTFLRILQSSQL